MIFNFPESDIFLANHFDHQDFLYYEAKKHCSSFRNSIDIGAHIGLFSSKMVKDFDYVFSFEPVFYNYLDQNIKSNNIKILPFGVSDANKEYNFKIKHTHTGMSKIDPTGTDKITCKKIDSFNFSNIDFCKIDVEGHELNVLLGMKDFFLNNSPVILIEINNKKNNV
jgi:FkbM family methyltransferase